MSKIAFLEKYPDCFLVFKTNNSQSTSNLYLVPEKHIKNKSIHVLRGLFSRHLSNGKCSTPRFVDSSDKWTEKDNGITNIKYCICQESETNSNHQWKLIKDFFDDPQLDFL